MKRSRSKKQAARCLHIRLQRILFDLTECNNSKVDPQVGDALSKASEYCKVAAAFVAHQNGLNVTPVENQDED